MQVQTVEFASADGKDPDWFLVFVEGQLKIEFTCESWISTDCPNISFEEFMVRFGP